MNADSNNTQPPGITISRRSFLNRSVVASTIGIFGAPTPAALGENMGASTIDALIFKCEALKASAEAADQKASAIWADPERPDMAHVLASEFRRLHWPMKEDRYGTLTSIDKIIDRHEDGQRQQLQWFREEDERPDAAATAALEAEFEHRFSASREERSRLHTLYAARKAIYNKWAVASGYADVEEESSSFWDQKFDVEEAILKFNCRTIEEVRAKAGYVVAEYGDEFSGDAANKFIAQLAEVRS